MFVVCGFIVVIVVIVIIVVFYCFKCKTDINVLFYIL